MSKIRKHIYTLLAMLTLMACNKPEDSRVHKELQPAPGAYEGGVYIVNEGNFDWGHGTMYHYDFLAEDAEVSEEIFFQKNDFELGNTVQSMTIHKDKAYIVVNNSERIEVVQPNSMEWMGRIDMPKASPRYLLPLTDKKAYVTDLYADGFWVVDLEYERVIKRVACSGWTEKMIAVDQYVYMTKTRSELDHREGGDVLLKIDANTDEIVDSLAMPRGSIDLEKDKLGKLWVLCSGGLTNPQPALVKVDEESFTIEREYPFNIQTQNWVSNLNISPQGDRLYYLNGGVYTMMITDDQVPSTPLIEEGNKLFFGMDVAPNGDIWVSDAVDYVQRGWAFRYSDEGEQLDVVRVGVIPNSFVFNE